MRTIDILTVLSFALSPAYSKVETQGIRLPLPTRELEWKDANFISISDSHGPSLSLDLDETKLIERLATRTSTCEPGRSFDCAQLTQKATWPEPARYLLCPLSSNGGLLMIELFRRLWRFRFFR